MMNTFFVFERRTISDVWEYVYAFADETSRRSYLEQRKYSGRDMKPINGEWVGISRMRIVFVVCGWTAHADEVYDGYTGRYYWRFSTPLIQERCYVDLNEFLEEMVRRNKDWNRQ